MIALVVPVIWSGLLGTLVLGVVAVQHVVEGRPTRRTSARERLVRRNPRLATYDQTHQLVWSATARRVRLGRLTVAAVSVALFLSTLRPTVDTTTVAPHA